MEDTKKWWQSSSIWGSVVAIGAVAAGFFGLDLDADAQAGITEAVLAIVAAAGGLLAIYGRVKASSSIE